jgi:hypothetical protein
MKYVCLLILVTMAPLLWVVSPAGRVSSSGPLTLNGKIVPATAASSLPVVAGDEIATSDSSALICFADRSRATIEPNSRVEVEANNSSVMLRVSSGSVELQRAEGSGVTLIEPIQRAAPRSAVGRGSPGSTGLFGDDLDCPPRSKHCPPKHPNCR